jgi:hypothetical protein
MFSPTITYMDTTKRCIWDRWGCSYALGGSGRELGPEVQSGLRPHRSAEDLRLPAGLFPAEEGADNPVNQHRAHCTSRNSSHRLWARPLVPTGRLRYTAWAYKEGQTSKRRSAFRTFFGGVAEWTNALVLKTRGGKTPVGSNPTAPAFSAPQHVVG